VLKIDPMRENILFSTFIGGGELDRVWDIAVNDEGLVYLTGMTLSGPEDGFPIGNGIPGYEQEHKGGSSIFLIILSSTGTDILYSSYFGGESIINDGLAVALDPEGNIFIGGNTTSSRDENFPIGGNIPGYDSTLNCDPSIWPGDPPTDAFVMKLDPSGMTILYSTYLGGEGYNFINRLMIDDHGNAHVSGKLGRLDTYGGLTENVVINSRNIWSHTYEKEKKTDFLILNPDGTEIIYAALPPFQSIILPHTQGLLMTGTISMHHDMIPFFLPSEEKEIPYSSLHNINDRQIFVVLLDLMNQQMLSSTNLIGHLLSLDQVAIDSTGNIYLLGTAEDTSLLQWESQYFSLTADDYEEAQQNICFLVKLDSSLEQILYACHFDTANRERYGHNFYLYLAVDDHEQAYIAGSISESFNEYAYVMKVDTTAVNLTVSEQTDSASTDLLMFWLIFLIVLCLLLLFYLVAKRARKKVH
jgi:hypothetical protein